MPNFRYSNIEQSRNISGKGRTYNHIIVTGVGDDLRRLDRVGLLVTAGGALGGVSMLQRAAQLTILSV